VLGGDSVNNSTPGFDSARVFLYSQTDATILGGEAMLDIHPSELRWFDWYTAYSYVDVRLNNVTTNEKFIPFTPPNRLRSEITVTLKKLNKALNNTYFRFGLLYSFEQSNVYQQANAYAGVPDAVPSTPAYTLLNAGLGTDFVSHDRKTLSLYISIDNIANTSYIDYMSRFKYYTNMVNGVPQVGVHNMGRNISFKVIVPIDFKGKKS
jgi:iron complex outermembrane receptor protein